jgi:autotransporter adhesin
VGGSNANAGVGIISIGGGANALSDFSVALGTNVSATGFDTASAVAIGNAQVAAGAGAVAIGDDNTAMGPGSIAIGRSVSASGPDTVAFGHSATASAASAVAIGGDATASAPSSIALGTGSVADQANTVSVGAVGGERRIVNVADATGDTDAVNLRQMNAALAALGNNSAALADLDSRIDVLEAFAGSVSHDLKRVDRRAAAGTATAIALSGAMFLPGKSFNLTGNVGSYRGAWAGAMQVGALVRDNVAVNAGLSRGFNKGGKTGFRAGFTIGF